MQNDKLVSDLNRSLMADIIRYKQMLKTHQGKQKNFRYNTSGPEEKPYEVLADSIKHNRDELKEIALQDPLKAKAQEYGRGPFMRTKHVTYYQDQKTGDISWRQETTDYVEKDINVTCYYVGYMDNRNNRYENVEALSPKFYWPDEMREFIRTNGRIKMHHKFEFIRIGNEFFSKRDYLLFDGKAYLRKDYGIQDGKLIDLSKVIKIHSNNQYVYATEFRNPKWGMDFFLESMPDEKFVNKLGEDANKAFLQIRAYHHDTTRGFFGSKFINTMFVSNKKRFYNSDSDYLYLTKEDAADLDFEPSEKHKEVYAKIEDAFINVRNKYNPSALMSKERFRSVIMSSMCFYVELRNRKTNGILGQILKELFPSSKALYADELKKRLAILRELLSKEKEYAK